MSDSKRHPAVGIDLGTTFSAVAHLNDSGRPETIRNAEGDLTTPSAVFFDQKKAIVGVEAVEAGLLEPERLALYAKRDVGEDRYGKAIRGEELPPEVLQALVLRKLKADSELLLGKVDKAVVTVPAFFNEPCRKATQDAGRIAGLEVMDIINEPTAAAITYGVQSGFLNKEGLSDQVERVLVYDLGGGTFDVTVMEIEKGNYNTIATAGDVYLGGIDWDRRLVDFIASEFSAEHGVDPSKDPCGEQELLRKANQAKHALTQRDSFAIAFAHEGMRLRTEISQSAFAEMSEDLVERTLMTVGMVLDDAKLQWKDLTRLILVGGSTRMPMIRSELEKHSGMNLDRSLSPDEAVCHGAALYAGMLLEGESSIHAQVSVRNVNSHDLGILAVEPKTGKPARQVMIPRNSSLPARRSMVFRTHADNQANVKINVVEGGDNRGVGATDIGKCVVENLPPKTPKGTEVQVQFDYAQDGRLTVSATLPAVKRTMEMTLNRAAGLSGDEIQSWIERIENGLTDDSVVAQEEEPKTPPQLGMAPLPLPTGVSPFDVNAGKTKDVVKPKPIVKPKAVPKLAAKKDNPFAGINVVDKAPKKPKVTTVGIGDLVDDSDAVAPAKPNPIIKPTVKPAASVVKPKPVIKPKPVVKAEQKNPVARPTPKLKSKPVIKPKADSLGAAKSNTAAPIPKPKPASKLVAPVAAKPQPKATGKPVPKATGKPIPKPVAKPKPAATKIQPPTKSAAKPKPKAKPVAKPKIDLGDQAPKAPLKSSEIPDFAEIAGLGDKPKTPASFAPVIVTTDGNKKGKKKKSKDPGADGGS